MFYDGWNVAGVFGSIPMQHRLAERSLAEHAVWREPVSTRNSLLTGKHTGNL